jgi:hypothetical protein
MQLVITDTQKVTDIFNNFGKVIRTSNFQYHIMTDFINHIRNSYPAYFIFAVSLTSILLINIPGFALLDNLGDCPLRHSIERKTVETASAVLTFCSFPIILDILLDLCVNTFSQLERYQILGRVVFTLTILLSGLQFLLGYGPYSDVLSNFVLALLWLRIALAASLLFCLNISKPTIFTAKYTMSIISIVCIESIIRSKTLVISNSIPLNIAALVLSIMVLFCIPLSLLVCFYFLCFQKSPWKPSDYAAFLYLIIFFISIIAIGNGPLSDLINRQNVKTNILEWTSYQISGTIYMYAYCAILFSIVPGRIARMNAISLKVSCIFILKTTVLSTHLNSFRMM